MFLTRWLDSVRARMSRSFRLSAGRRPIRRRQAPSGVRSMEILEVRSFPAATPITATFNAGLLNIQGTNNADAITVSQVNDQISVAGIQINSNGRLVSQIAASQVQQILVAGLEGNDTIELSGIGLSEGVKSVITTTIDGGSGNDTLTGGGANEKLMGGVGDDLIYGRGGDDTLQGGDGADMLDGGAGTNVTDGGPGLDTIDGVPESVTYALSSIVQAYNDGRLKLIDPKSPLIKFIADSGLGDRLVDLPVVEESLSSVLDIASKLQQVFENSFSVSATQAELEQTWRSLEQAGFHLDYLGTSPNSDGDLLRVTFDRTFDQTKATFNTAGKTGFDYFDKDVNGSLSGSVSATTPSLRVKVSFGVDVVHGTPMFFVADTSSVKFEGLKGNAQLKESELAIGNLADVKVNSQLKLDLSGGVTLRDSDSDHKLRISDLSRSSSIVGDVDGSVTLDGKFQTNVPVLKNMEWTGHWTATITDGKVTIGTPVIEKPSTAAVATAVLGSLKDLLGGYNLLGPNGNGLEDSMRGKLDVFDFSIADKLGIGKTLSDAGIKLAEINDATVTKLINGERVDLIRFESSADNNIWSTDQKFTLGVVPLPPPLSFIQVAVSATLRAGLGWDYFVGMGIDTTGVYIDPRTHVGINGNVRAGIEGELTVFGLFGVGVEAGAGVQVSAGLGLEDPDPSDGRIYLDEISAQGSNFLDGMLHVLRFDLNVSAFAYARAELNLPWPLPDITLFDERVTLSSSVTTHHSPTDTKNHRKIPLPGKGDLPAPVTFENGVLFINGTADRDYVSLGEKDGRVQVRWAGYRAVEFDRSLVRRVTFNGNGDDDQLTADSNFSVPINADGGDGNDILYGGAANDTLNGGAGNDRILGRAGNDFINGDAGNDEVDGGDGNDQLNGGLGMDSLRGGLGNDNLYGNEDRDLLEGGANDDTLNSGAGNDLVFGGSGNDSLDGGDGDDALQGESGDDLLIGGAGLDSLSGGENNDTLRGGTNNDLLIGDSGNDQLFGGDGNDSLLGAEGSDLINGENGNDALHGNAGQDTLNGGDQDDKQFGGDGNDLLNGGNGNDFLNGEAGTDTVNGDADQDTIALDLRTSAGAITDVISGGTHKDSLFISPMIPDYNALSQGNYTQANLTGNNKLRVTQTSDTKFLVEQFDPKSNQLLGSLGFQLTADSNTDLETLTIAGLDGDDSIEVVDQGAKYHRDIILDGGEGNDTLIGGAGRDVLRGQTGNDSLVGNANDDELHGGSDNDTLVGNDGTDRLYGDDGDDSMNSGAGHDYQVGGVGNDVIDAGNGLTGDVIYGGNGTDTIKGGDGVDFIDGGDGNDSISGGSMSDFLDGSGGNDTIVGGKGTDILLGGEGDDLLTAGTSETEAVRSAVDWLAQELTIRSDMAALNDEILAVTAEVERLRSNPEDKRTADDVAQLAQLAQQEVDLRALEDQLSEVKRELNRERGAFLVNELSKLGITLNYQAILQDMVVGGSGNDTLTGGAFRDMLIGGDGDDQFRHSAGQDQVIGGEGLDTYLLDGTEYKDQIKITAIQDESSNLAFDVDLVANSVRLTSRLSLSPDMEAVGVRGLGGNDTMIAKLGLNAQGRIRFEGGEGNDSIDVQGTQSNATLFGGNGDDSLRGGNGHDQIFGDAGNDTLIGEAGDDAIEGANGDDWLYGGSGKDLLKGGNDNDNIRGDNGGADLGDADRIFGESGNDTLSGNGGSDNLDGGDGHDWIYGELGDDTLWGQGGNDTLFGDRGDNTGDGRDMLEGGLGDDFQAGGGGDDLIEADEGNDTLIGNRGRDTLRGHGGNDAMWGDDRESVGSAGDADSLHGGVGDDILYGGGGNDTLKGYFGNDSLWGGMGSDNLQGEDGNDTIRGDSGADSVGDADSIDGGSDDDWIRGDGGNDTITSGSGIDTVNGGNGADEMSTNPNADFLPGYDSSDVVTFTQSSDEIVKWVVWSNGTLVTLRRDNAVYRNGTLGAHNINDIAVTTSGILYYLRTNGELIRFLPDGTSATVANGVKKLEVERNSAYYLTGTTVWLKEGTASAKEIRSYWRTVSPTLGVKDFALARENNGRTTYYELLTNGNVFRRVINGNWSSSGLAVNDANGANLGNGSGQKIEVETRTNFHVVRVLKSDGMIGRANLEFNNQYASGRVVDFEPNSISNVKDFTVAEGAVFVLKKDGRVYFYGKNNPVEVYSTTQSASGVTIEVTHDWKYWFLRDVNGKEIESTGGMTPAKFR